MFATETTLFNLIVETAKSEAAGFDASVVDVEYLLLALSLVDSSAKTHLNQQGVTSEKVLQALQNLADEDSINFDPQFSAPAPKQFFQRKGALSAQAKAIINAAKADSNSELSLLQFLLTEPSGKVARLLKECGSSLVEVRKAVGSTPYVPTVSQPATVFELGRVFVFYLIFMRLWLGLMQWFLNGDSLTAWDTWLNIDRWITALGVSLLFTIVQARKSR